jgi:hypothetical protein
MNPDGISYLDIGDAYMRGDWAAAINSVWSPMYSWILGLVMHVLKPSMRWEFPVVHMINFAIYLVAIVCFEFFWRQVINYNKTRIADKSDNSLISLPEWAWISLGYILFIYSSLNLIEIWAVTPDMLMGAFVYLAAGFILRIRLGYSTWHTFVLLGITLALGYLAKAVMFPLAFVFLVVSVLSVGNLRRALPLVLVAMTVFLMIITPYMAAVSIAKGKLTFSNVGKLTYSRHVNGIPYPHWQGDPPGNGIPEHPSRRIFSTPPIYEFGSPIAGTYPISYDPSHWYEGLVFRFDFKNQFEYLLTSTLFYFDLFFRQQAGLLIGVLLLYFLSRWNAVGLKEILRQWGLVIPALAVFGFYGLVCVAGRYVGVFVVLFWGELLANVRIPDSQQYRRLASLLSAVMILFVLMNIATFNLEGFRDLTGITTGNVKAKQQARSPKWPGQVAEELHRVGVQPGDKVAVVGYAFESYWARLARVKIMAEMLGWEADPLWLGGPAVQSRVLKAFRSTGAKAIVAEHVPSYAHLRDWHQINDTNYYIYLFSS